MYGMATSYSSANTALVSSLDDPGCHRGADRCHSLARGGGRRPPEDLPPPRASITRMPGVRNRVAVVTGAANGLGREIALALAREGARVALGDMDAAGVEQTAAAITAAGGVAVTVAGDLTDEAPAARLIEAAVERLGGLDILVNNVGGSRNRKIWEMPVEDWDFVLRLNLRSTSQSSTGISQIFRLRLPPTLLTRMSR